MSECFPEPKSSRGRLKIELDLFNYAIKADLRNATSVDTTKFVKKVDLATLKSDVDKLDIDKLKDVPNNVSNMKSEVDKLDVDKLVFFPVELSHVVKMMSLKEIYIMLIYQKY